MKAVTIVVLSLFFTSCNEIQNGKNNENNRIALSDSVIKEMPERIKTDSSWQKKIDKINEMMNLSSLQNGFDELQIRIWVGCSSRDSQSLIVLKKDIAGWDAMFYTYKISWGNDAGIEGNKDSNFEFKDIRINHRNPKSGWTIFSERLMKTGIVDLPDYDKLYPNYNYPSDARAVTVEIGSYKKYRFYQYPELGLNKDNSKGPARLAEALLLIEREFNYKRPCQ